MEKDWEKERVGGMRECANVRRRQNAKEGRRVSWGVYMSSSLFPSRSHAHTPPPSTCHKFSWPADCSWISVFFGDTAQKSRPAVVRPPCLLCAPVAAFGICAGVWCEKCETGSVSAVMAMRVMVTRAQPGASPCKKTLVTGAGRDREGTVTSGPRRSGQSSACGGNVPQVNVSPPH